MRQNGPKYLQIGELAKYSGVKIGALRYYDEIGLLKPSHIGASRYRHYKPSDVSLVLFIKKSQGLGFSLDEIREILDERKHGRSPCPKVRQLAQEKINRLHKEIHDLENLEEKLRKYIVEAKKLDTSFECEIICDLIDRA